MTNEKRLMYVEDFLDLFYVASAGQDKAFVKAVEMVAEDTPTIDAVEVVHAEWVWKDGCFHCTNCKQTEDHITKYCHGCGAKMDGERREGE